jgi:glycosyltransferase involved in cell wall biosynthesis
VIGWRAANLPFLADHEREGLLAPPGDVGALREALRRIAVDDELRDRLGRAAGRRAASRPTWDETAARFFALLRAAPAPRRA